MLNIFTALVLIFSSQAPAWELFPEYLNLSEQEQVEFDRPSQTDSEYQSDIMAFSRSADDDYDFYSAPQALLIGMGSLGSKDFYIHDAVKVESALSSNLKMRFTYLREKDWDRESEAAIIELEQALSKKWAVGIFGEAMHRKAEIDYSLALFFKPSDEHTIRFYYGFPDFSRNKRNELEDRFETAPKVYGLTGRWVKPRETESREFLIYSLRHEEPVTWIFPKEEYHYFYERNSVCIYSRFRYLNHYFVVRADSEKKSEVKALSNSLSPFTGQGKWERTKHILQLEVERPLSARPETSFRLGVVGAVREFKADRGHLTQVNHLPYFWYKAPAFMTAGVRDFFQVGLDTTFFRETGQEILAERTVGELKEEHRLSSSYDFHLLNDARLRLIFTFDLDRFGTGETWEGGAGTFQMAF
jgi:hypothetical protein